MTNKKKKKLLAIYSSISVFVVAIMIIVMIFASDLNSDFAKMVNDANGRIAASVTTYECPSGYVLSGTTCYHCSSGYNEYDHKCYRKAEWKSQGCPVNTTRRYYSGEYICTLNDGKTWTFSGSSTTYSNSVVANSQICEAMNKKPAYRATINDNGTYHCYVITHKSVPGGYDCGTNTLVSYVQRNSNYIEYGYYCRTNPATVSATKKVQITATFNANGGTVASQPSKVLQAGTTFGTLPTTTRSNCTFTGWYTAATGGTKIDQNSVVPSSDTAYYAHWTVSLTFNANGGTTASPVTLTREPGATIGSPLPTTSRTGYTFDGWYTAATGGTKISTSTVVTAHTAYYAHWTAGSSGSGGSGGTEGGTGGQGSTITTRTATFNANGGSSVNSITLAVGTALGTLPTTKRTGYVFAGWYTAATGGTQISSSTTMPSSNVTYYAHWNVLKLKVTYRYNVPGTNDLLTNLETPYQGANWSCQYDGETHGNHTQAVDSDIAYGSSYKVWKHWVKCQGYELDGWNEKADGSGVYWTAGSTWGKWGTFNGDTYERDVVLYAIWKPIDYKIKYHGNGGLYNDSDSWLDPRNFTFYEVYPGANDSQPIIYSNNNFFYRTGYNFTGWKTKAGYANWVTGYSGDSTKKWRVYDGYKNGSVSIGIGDETLHQLDLYAQWEPITYTIKFDKNHADATGTMANVSKTYGVTTIAPENGFTREGYALAGWNTKADGSGTTIADGGKIGTLTKLGGNVVTLYAQWVIDDDSIGAKDGTYIKRLLNDTPAKMRKLTKFKNARMFHKGNQMAENDVFKTGNTLEISENTQTNGYIIYVLSDTNKDGKLSFADVVGAYRTFRATNPTKNEVWYASDYDENNELNMVDVIKIYKSMKGGVLNEE